MIALALVGIKFLLLSTAVIALLAGGAAASKYAGTALNTAGAVAGAFAHNADEFMNGYKSIEGGSAPKKLAPGPVPPNATSVDN